MTDPQPSQEQAWTTRRVWMIIGASAGVAVILAVIGVRIAVDASGEPIAPVAAQTTVAVAPTTTTPVAEATTTPPPLARTIDMSCSGDDDQDIAVTVAADSERPDFASAWGLSVHDCLVEAVEGSASDSVAPVSDVEVAALKASKYDEPDIATLFEMCAARGPENYVRDEAGTALSPEQTAELAGALTLCPNHPDAATWRKAIQAGQKDAKLEAEGRIFYDGTYRVGKEIKPGTYVVKDVENCYWERQTSSGGIIDNNFVAGAKRVQVTIRKSDYGFHAEGCGQWRPAG